MKGNVAIVASKFWQYCFSLQFAKCDLVEGLFHSYSQIYFVVFIRNINFYFIFCRT